MPLGKPAGVRCAQLDEDYRCRVFGLPGRPEVCGSLQACGEMCGDNREQALLRLEWLEKETSV
jgi:hypothetical protein